MESDDVTPSSFTSQPLERSISQQSATSTNSRRSATVRARNATSYKRSSTSGSATRLGYTPSSSFTSHPPGSSASSIAASDKSLTSFPSFSPEALGIERSGGEDDLHHRNGLEQEHWQDRLKTARQETITSRNKVPTSIVDTLTAQTSSFSRAGREGGGTGARGGREALFEDAPLPRTIPGALHTADDKHIERLISRHGAVGLVRQIAQDLAERDAQISTLRRRADERERALRKILRECGLSTLDVETRLRTVEEEIRLNGKKDEPDGGVLSDMMSDAMGDTMQGYGFYSGFEDTIKRPTQGDSGKEPGKDGGTIKGWKEYLLGSGTKKPSRASSIAGDKIGPLTMVRSQSNNGGRPTLQEDLFRPPEPPGPSHSPSRASSIHSGAGERKGSSSLASKALRLVAGGSGGASEADLRGRAISAADRTAVNRSMRGTSATSNNTRSSRAVSVAGGPKSLMAMRRTTATTMQSVDGAGSGPKSQAQELWGSMVGSPPSVASNSGQESYGPVEMDAILPPESQPPTLTHIYNNYANSEYLTDRFGFIYDQRRKKRQREAAQMAKHSRKTSRQEMLANGRSGISPNMLEDLPSPRWSVSSGDKPASINEPEEQPTGVLESKPKRWQDYLKIATIPTELLSHTPSMGTASLEVLEAPEDPEISTPTNEPIGKSPAITPTESGLVPLASTTTALDTGVEGTQQSDTDSGSGMLVSDDTEPVKLLLQQLSDVHDSLQQEKTVRWNEFLRKVRAERRREGEAAVAAATAAAEARYERPAVILPESRINDGEMIGISGLGNKGKVGRAKWNEFKALVLGGIPVEYRAKIWSECCGAAALRVPGYYDDLVAQNGDDDDPAVVSQIKMDIHRTLPDNIFFRKGPGVKKLSEVLLAYSRRNQDVGYCQGMNLIAASLLLIMPSAEDTFWILTSIVENILPQGYYDHSLISSRADQQVLRQYVSTVLPKLSAHLDSLSIELEALTFQWFLSVFTDCLSAEALFRVWDVVLCSSAANEGSTFLFQVALALLKLNEGNLLQCNTAAGVYTYINHHMTEHAISIDGLIQASEGLRRLVKSEDVVERRKAVVDAERQGMMGVGRGRDGDLTVVESRPIDG